MSLLENPLLANRIVDIELRKFVCWPNKFSVFPTKEFVIVFCLTTIFIRRTKILLGQQKKVCQLHIFLHI